MALNNRTLISEILTQRVLAGRFSFPVQLLSLARRALVLSAIGVIVLAPFEAAQAQDCSSESGLKSAPSDTAVELSFRNAASGAKRLYWVDFEGRRKFYAVIQPDNVYRQSTFAGHPWIITDEAERCLTVVIASTASMTVDIGGPVVTRTAPPPGIQQPLDHSPATAQPTPIPPPFLPVAPVKPQPAQLRCGQNYQMINGQCVIKQNCGANAYRSAEGDCYCNSGYQKSGGKCINSNVAKGFEAAPWKKPGCGSWKAQCDRGNARACASYESTCLVN